MRQRIEPGEQKDKSRFGQGRWRSERGAAVVEFAIVSVLLLSLIYGGITYGVVFWVKHTMTSAAAEGARSALNVTPGDEAAAIAAAVAKAEGALDASLDDKAGPTDSDGVCGGTTRCVVATVDDCVGSSQRCITVTVSYPYGDEPILPPLPFLPFVPDELSSTSVVELNS